MSVERHRTQVFLAIALVVPTVLGLLGLLYLAIRMNASTLTVWTLGTSVTLLMAMGLVLLLVVIRNQQRRRG